MGNETEFLANRDVLATTLAPDAGLRAREEKVIRAMAAVCAERTYAATSIAEVVRRAGISSRTFYKLFPGKRECFDAALAAFAAELESAVEAARTGEQSWPAEVRAAIAAILRASAAKAAFATLAFVRAIAGRPGARGRNPNPAGPAPPATRPAWAAPRPDRPEPARASDRGDGACQCHQGLQRGRGRRRPRGLRGGTGDLLRALRGQARLLPGRPRDARRRPVLGGAEDLREAGPLAGADPQRPGGGADLASGGRRRGAGDGGRGRPGRAGLRRALPGELPPLHGDARRGPRAERDGPGSAADLEHRRRRRLRPHLRGDLPRPQRRAAKPPPHPHLRAVDAFRRCGGRPRRGAAGESGVAPTSPSHLFWSAN